MLSSYPRPPPPTPVVNAHTNPPISEEEPEVWKSDGTRPKVRSSQNVHVVSLTASILRSNGIWKPGGPVVHVTALKPRCVLTHWRLIGWDKPISIRQ